MTIVARNVKFGMRAYHFLISSRPDLDDGGQFPSKLVLGTHVIYHEIPHAAEIKCGQQHVGYILGDWGELDQSQAFKAGDTIDAPDTVLESIQLGTAFFHDRFCGRYLVILRIGEASWLFSDVAGGYPAVVDLETGVAGSSAYTVLNNSKDYASRIDEGLAKITNLEADDWYPSALTAHKGLFRLLPNHALNLESLDIVRVWPLQQLPKTAPSIPRLVQTMTRVCAAALAHVPDDQRAYVTLTAGRDSRMALSCCRPLAKAISAFTLNTSPVEAYIAKRLSRMAGIPHTTVNLKTADSAEREGWKLRTGHCVGGANMRNFPTIPANFSPTGVFISGIGGEIGRAFYWASGDTEHRPIDPATLLLRFRLKAHPDFLAKTAAWLAELEHLDTLSILDLAYVEQRMGAWGSPQRYGSLGHPAVFSPFCTRAYIEHTLTSPAEYRRGNLVVDDVIKAQWPELLDLPFNRFGDVRDFLPSARKFHPSNLRRKLRQFLGRAV